MKRIFGLLLVLIVVSLSYFSCSKDNVNLVSYSDGKVKHYLKIKDVKNDILNVLNSQREVVNDINWFKIYLFDKFIVPELAVFYLKEKGTFESESFKNDFINNSNKIYLLELHRKGKAIFNEIKTNIPIDIARASHILIKVDEYTNINGKVTSLPKEKINILNKNAEQKALKIIDILKKSTNLETDFKNIASAMSDDKYSAAVGGDLDYFPKGAMVTEFEDAVFNANKTGLIEKPVKTRYGYHIIMVTHLPSEVNITEFEKMIGTEKFRKISGNLFNNFFMKERDKNIQEFYKFDLTNNIFVLNDKIYNSNNLNNIPDNEKVIKVYNTTYNWGEVKNIINIFVPDFIKNLNLEILHNQLINFKNFMIFVELAKNYNYDIKKEFKNLLLSKVKDSYKVLASQYLYNELRENSSKQVTPELITNYYNSMSNTFTKRVKDKKGNEINVVKTLTEAYDDVKNELNRNLMREYLDKWKQEAKDKYKVRFIDKGLDKLIAVGKDYIEKKKKETMKNNKKNK